ncbi:uncharacterized protein LOC117576528 [Drosophila albomicans]|uniref:Uncharacterized protein LOC117576528 n=1 Tax=Drosophila albomicans TaxID=7291 RepID=A0A6P8ZEZ1_DROAB|nr:uncharacterized protein LOC117576528 [Drosophila albomicans]
MASLTFVRSLTPKSNSQRFHSLFPPSFPLPLLIAGVQSPVQSARCVPCLMSKCHLSWLTISSVLCFLFDDDDDIGGRCFSCCLCCSCRTNLSCASISYLVTAQIFDA